MEKRLNLQMGNIGCIFIEIFQNKNIVGLNYAPSQGFQYLHKN